MTARTFQPRHLFTRRLSQLHELSAVDEQALLDVLGPPREVHKDRDIICDGSAPSSVSIVTGGVARRYKLLSDGQRQILGFLLPGDMADDFASDVTFDHGVSAATNCFIQTISRAAFDRLMDCFPDVARAIYRYCLVQASIYRSWLINMRRRTAPERLAHLLCEQFARLQAVGLAEQGKPVPLHILQSDLADATGMSAIHVNRTLQYLRSRNLIGRNPANFEILDWEGLQELAQFEASYLRFDRGQRRPSWRETTQQGGRLLAFSG